VRERSIKGHLIILARAINGIPSTTMANTGATTHYISTAAAKRAS